MLCRTLLLALVMGTFATDTTIHDHFTFSVANSPHYINSTIIFTASSNVIIENGAEIVFMEHFALQFHGNVSCGCEDIDTISDQRGLMDNVTFVHIRSGVKNSWGSYANRGEIVVNHEANGDHVQVRFCNTKFEAITSAMRFSQRQLYDIKVDNCEFTHVARVIDNPFTASSQLGVTYITDSVTTGSSRSGWFSMGGRTVYRNNDIYSNPNFDYNESVYHQIAISSSNIRGSLNSACVVFLAFEGDPKMAFHNNTVQHCGMGIYISDRNTTMNNADEIYITGNTFAQMEFNAISFVRTRANLIHIAHNVFKDTESGRRETGGQSRMTGVIQTDDFNPGLSTKHQIVIQNNTFLNNNCSDPMINLKTTNHESSVSLLHNKVVNNAQWKGRIFFRGYDTVHIASNYMTNTYFTFSTWYKLSGYVDQKYLSPAYINISNNELSDVHVYMEQMFATNHMLADISENVFHGRTDITFVKSVATVQFRCNNLYGLYYFSWRSSGQCARDLKLSANRNYFNGETNVIPTRDEMHSNSFGNSYCCACHQGINVTVNTVYEEPITDVASCEAATYALTAKPTLYPTRYPTGSPTVNPSQDPSMDPTNHPTELPSLLPSNQPSKPPTFEPSLYLTSTHSTAYDNYVRTDVVKSTVYSAVRIQSSVLTLSSNSTHTNWTEVHKDKHKQFGILFVAIVIFAMIVVIGITICVKKRKLKGQLLDVRNENEQKESMMKHAENKASVVIFR